jgi:hypothetical protein
MNWPDWMLSAGLLIGLVGAALALRQVKRKLWPARASHVERLAPGSSLGAAAAAFAALRLPYT